VIFYKLTFVFVMFNIVIEMTALKQGSYFFAKYLGEKTDAKII